MSKLQTFRVFVNERLAAVAEEIFALFERTLTEFEEELCRQQKENQRKVQLQDTALNVRVLLHRVDTGPSLKQVSEIPKVKEEPEEQRSIKQEEEELNPGFSAVCVTREEPSLLQGRQPQHQEETKGEDFRSETSAETDNNEDWTQPMEAEPEEDQCNQVQTRDEGTKPQNKTGPDQTSDTVNNGEMLSSDVGAERKKLPNSVHQKRFGKSTNKKPYSCSFCNSLFACKSNLTKHQRIHSGEKPYSCSVCNKTFSYSSCVERHKRIHSGEKPYSCTVCNKAFSRSSYLVTHKRIHSGEKPYSCTVCNKAFSRSSCVERHKRIHSGEKPYSCTVCNKAFTASGYLVTHKRIHSGEKPYSCPVCNKAFTDSSHLAQHKRRHTGEKPYSCTVCNKAFSRSSYLAEHKRTHSGEKPYSCTLCNKAFTNRSYLLRHKRIHWGETLQLHSV